MNRSRIQEGLRALAEAEHRRPSATIEAALLGELQRAARATRWKVAVVLGSLAAGLACLIFVSRPHSRDAQVIAVQPVVAAARPMAESPSPIPAPRHRRRVHRSVMPAQEVAVAEFTEVPFAAPLDTGERAQLVRVSMPVTTLASWGFNMDASDPDRVVNADVVVGENGLARAVRLLR